MLSLTVAYLEGDWEERMLCNLGVIGLESTF